MKPEFSRQISQNPSNITFHENPSMGAQLFHAAGRTDTTKLTIVCPNFANASKNDHDLCNVLYQHSVTKYLRIPDPETRFEPANSM